jgi:sugar phosphate isomerase/epimerase
MAADRSFAEVGDGTLDLPAVFAASEQGARWYIVENDAPKMPSLESARRSLENLRALGKA